MLDESIEIDHVASNMGAYVAEGEHRCIVFC